MPEVMHIIQKAERNLEILRYLLDHVREQAKPQMLLIFSLVEAE